MDDAFERIARRAVLVRVIVNDPQATFEQLDTAARSLEDLAAQLASLPWEHTGHADLYEQIQDARAVLLHRMADTA